MDSALSVVANELDGEVKAHNGDECNPGKHRTPQHLISSIIAIICRGMYGLRGWILRSTLAMLKPANFARVA